jgi:hypothetical protein
VNEAHVLLGKVVHKRQHNIQTRQDGGFNYKLGNVSGFMREYSTIQLRGVQPGNIFPATFPLVIRYIYYSDMTWYDGYGKVAFIPCILECCKP